MSASPTAFAYEELSFLRRPSKPRETGLTMMIDWGLPVTEQQGILQIAAPYVDLAKIAVGLSGLIAADVLEQKLRTYLDHGVRPFPGGMFLELAVAQDKLDQYLLTTSRLGYPIVEVSDNVVKLGRKRKAEIIRAAAEDHGLIVLGEVGSKHKATDASELIRDAGECLAAGAWKVFIEAAEFFDGKHFSDKLALQLASELPLSQLIFELPGAWIAGIHSHQIHSTMTWLVTQFGSDVNTGNVAPESALTLETLRTGTGVTMSFDPRTPNRGDSTPSRQLEESR